MTAVCSVPHTPAEKFLLLPKNGDHDTVVFPDIPDGELPSVADRPVKRHLPAVPSGFVGRRTEMHEVVKALAGDSTDVRLVVVKGMAGLGKTAIVKAACHYLAERRE